MLESETLYVYEQKTIDKEFDTHELRPGDYVLGVELIYPEGVAVASSQFKVKEEYEREFKWVFVVALVVLLILVFIKMIIMIWKYEKMRKGMKCK